MPEKPKKILSLILSILFIFEQSSFAQVAQTIDISGYFKQAHANSFNQDKFRPLHLRSIGYDNLNNSFSVLLDKGSAPPDSKLALEQVTNELLKYFFIGLTLPNSSFWVNLRPDAPDNIIDDDLAQTDVGKILLEADLQLKKDTAQFTSPETREGKEYWDKLYQKAEELYGTSSNITIPTLTRPWIVPDEVIIRESQDNGSIALTTSAYIYKATLKVMLEQDYLKDSPQYNFKDELQKQLNEYSSQLIRELIIPKLTKEINTSKRYANLRQVYYSLILAQWFKQKYKGRFSESSSLLGRTVPDIDSGDLTNLTSQEPYDKQTYFQQYRKSFKQGEYNHKATIPTAYGQTIRSYMSGGLNLMVGIPLTTQVPGDVPVAGSPVVVIKAERELPMGSNTIGPFKVTGLPAEVDLKMVSSAVQEKADTISPLDTVPLRPDAIVSIKPKGIFRSTFEAYQTFRIRFLKRVAFTGFKAPVRDLERIFPSSSDAHKIAILNALREVNRRVYSHTAKEPLARLIPQLEKDFPLASEAYKTVVLDELRHEHESLARIFPSASEAQKATIINALIGTNSSKAIKALESFIPQLEKDFPLMSNDDYKTASFNLFVKLVQYDVFQPVADALERILPSTSEYQKTAFLDILRDMAITYGSERQKTAIKALERLSPQLKKDFLSTSNEVYKMAIHNTLRRVYSVSSFNSATGEVLTRLIPQMEKDFPSALDAYKTFILDALRYQYASLARIFPLASVVQQNDIVDKLIRDFYENRKTAEFLGSILSVASEHIRTTTIKTLLMETTTRDHHLSDTGVLITSIFSLSSEVQKKAILDIVKNFVIKSDVGKLKQIPRVTSVSLENIHLQMEKDFPLASEAYQKVILDELKYEHPSLVRITPSSSEAQKIVIFNKLTDGSSGQNKSLEIFLLQLVEDYSILSEGFKDIIIKFLKDNLHRNEMYLCREVFLKFIPPMEKDFPLVSEVRQTAIFNDLVYALSAGGYGGYDYIDEKVVEEALARIFRLFSEIRRADIVKDLIKLKNETALRSLIPRTEEDFPSVSYDTYKITILEAIDLISHSSRYELAQKAFARLIPQLEKDFPSASDALKTIFMNMLVRQFNQGIVDSAREEARRAVVRLLPELGKDFLSASEDYKTAIMNALGERNIFADNLEVILEVFYPKLSPSAAKVRLIFSSLAQPDFLIRPILDGSLNEVIKESGADIPTFVKSVFKHQGIAPELKVNILNALINIVKPESQLIAESIIDLFGLSEQKLRDKVVEFINKERSEIIEIINYLGKAEMVPALSFFEDFLRKRDTSFLDIIKSAMDDDILSSIPAMAPQVKLLLNLEKKYEVLRGAMGYLIETGIILKGASLEYNASQKIDDILARYSKNDGIGDKKLLSELSIINRQVKSDAFKKIINRDLTEEEKEFLDTHYMATYIGNFVGLYFRLQGEYPGICEKAALSINKLLEFRDTKGFNQWLFKEAEWNKEVYAELLKSGYSSLLWDKGIRKTLPMEGIGEDITDKMKQQNEQLIELADMHNIEIGASYREKGLTSHQEAEAFAKEYFLNNEKLSQDVKDSVKRILGETKRFEEVYKSKGISSEKVTVEIVQDFLKDTYAVGIPGCFAPHGSNNQMPMIHALETNALFLRIYNGNDKMIANAVLVLTPQGVVVQPLWNASNLDLNKVVFEGLAELLLKDMVPAVSFSDASSAGKEALKYGGQEGITAVKKNTLDTDLYFDFSSSNSDVKTEFSMPYTLTKENLKDFKPSAEEIKESLNQQREKRLSEEDRKKISKELFSADGLGDIAMGPVLKNIEEIIFDWEEKEIEKLISFLTTRFPPKRGISEAEKGILKAKLLEIKGRPLELQAAAASPLELKSLEPASSSALQNKPGGIDLTALPIVTQSALNQPLITNMPIASSALNLNINLENELKQIQAMVNAGIMPSSERIREYALASSSLQKEEGYAQEIGRILGCIAEILRLEEDRGVSTALALKEMLILLESDKPARDVQFALSKITVMPKEPANYSAQ